MARPKKTTHRANNESREIKKHKEDVIRWQAPEFQYYPKDVSWYWMSLVAAIILVAIGLWQKNFLFSIFVIIAELLFLYFSNSYPKIWDFKLDEKSLMIGRKVYHYSEMEFFDIHPINDEFKELVFKMKSKANPYLKIFTHYDDEEKISEFLSDYLERQEISLSIIESFGKLIRF
ncbi:MAG: hypothetical protein QMD86_02080 [Patescibacteria group bacterium]|nr:hypothetical protein [Patescibacteria group bacterium]